MADVGIFFGWKAMERLTHANSLKEAGFSLLGLLGAPFVGYLFGSMINGLVPTPSTETIQIIPAISPFTYTPPTLEVETPTAPGAPTPPPTPPAYAYIPVMDISLALPKSSYELRWDMGTDKTLSIDTPTYEVEVS
jgi:hypothetical protein